jgi:hypothetical protein
MRASSTSGLAIALAAAAGGALAKDFPNVPESFRTFLVFSDPAQRSTVQMMEAFDYDANQYRITLRYSHTHHMDMYIDENLRKFARVENGTKCTMNDITPESTSGFGDIIDFGTGHLKHVSQMMHFDRSSNATYVGVTTRRGIECDEWSIAYTENHDKFNTDVRMRHYFAVEGWKFGDEGGDSGTGSGAGGQYQRPVETVATGVATEKATGEVHPFDVTYEWVGMHAGKPDPHVLNIPSICTDGPDVAKFPTELAEDFKVVIEANLEENGYTVGITEWHDFSSNRARFAHETDTGRRDDLFRIDTGKHYRVETDTAGKITCTESAIDSNGKFIDQGSLGTTAHLKHTKDMFRLVDGSEFTFGGETRVRGIAAHSWSATVSHPSKDGGTMSYRLTWSFRAAEWGYRGTDGSGPDAKAVPLRAAMSGHRIDADGAFHRVEHSYEFVDWVSGPVADANVFAVPVACGGTGRIDELNGDGSTTGTDSSKASGVGSRAGRDAAIVIITMIFSVAAASVAAFVFFKRREARRSTPTAPFEGGAGGAGGIQHGSIMQHEDSPPLAPQAQI